MKPYVVFLICMFPVCAFTQNNLEPGAKSLNPVALYAGTFEWQWYKNAGDAFGEELGKVLVKVLRTDQKITLVKRRMSSKIDIDETDSVVIDAKTMLPIYSSFKGEEVSYFIQYGAMMKGTRTIHETKKKQSLSEVFDGKYFYIESLPLVVSSLPLSPGYQAVIPVVSFNGDFKPVYTKYKILEVEEKDIISERSGLQKAWKVKVLDKKDGNEYLFHINKATRRIIRTDLSFSSILSTYNFFDRELDVNPIKATFNANETMSMLTKGSGTVTGQVYFRGYGKKMGDSRDKKKQFAEKGTSILLIPNTPYFKEWAEYNIKLSKLSGPVYTINWGGYFGQQGEKDKTTIGTFFPLPEDVTKCILVTTVNDDKGHFVFQNLKPGEYLLFVTYAVDKYSHTTSEYKGQYTAVYGDGYIESYPLWDVKDWTTPDDIKAHKYVTIKKEGETVNVVFKD